MKNYTFHVKGTHCASCKILIEDVLGEESMVKNVNVDLKKETVNIETDTEKSPEELAKILTEKIKPNGYTLSVEKQDKTGASNEILWKAVPIGLFFLVVFFVLQKSGILNFGIGGKVTPLTSFIVGLVASVSSCLAVVGGLILSLSAKISQDNIDDKKNMVIFHISRILSFTILGGVLGMLGGFIGVNFTFTAVLGLIASAIMLLLGFNLVGIFEKNKLTLPSGIFNFFKKIEHKTFAPMVLGFGTFFLPCGFTQSMQIVALGSGSFWTGAMIMFAFSLGTLPMLSLLSFGSAKLSHGKNKDLFFKSAGVVVIGLGIFAILTGLAGLGIIEPLFNI